MSDKQSVCPPHHLSVLSPGIYLLAIKSKPIHPTTEGRLATVQGFHSLPKEQSLGIESDNSSEDWSLVF